MSYEKVKQAKHLSVGMKQTMKAIELNKARELIIANDADKRLVAKVIQFGKEKKLPITYVDSMKKLGRACGIDVGAATVALLKEE